jgi:metal-responsive CopG/Arc/MetJ family transcriptional regulator
MTSTKPRILNFHVDPQLLSQLDDFRFKHHHSTRAAAIKAIIRMGIDADDLIEKTVKAELASILWPITMARGYVALGEKEAADAQLAQLQSEAESGELEAKAVEIARMVVVEVAKDAAT